MLGSAERGVMTRQEILERAIRKAIDGGWDTTHFSTLKGEQYKHPDEAEFHDLTGSWHSISPADIIFNHDFAKALWGEDVIDPTGPVVGGEIVAITVNAQPWEDEEERSTYTERDHAKDVLLNPHRYMPIWQYHLQQMVIAEDPIAYLEQNL